MPQQTLNELPDDLLQEMIDRIGKSSYVVINKAGTSVVKNPGMGGVFHTKIKKQAELVAKEAGGHAITLGEAIDVLTKHYSKQKLKK